MSRYLLLFCCASGVAFNALAETKIQGSIDCDKADPLHSLPVPDRQGLAFSIAQHRCTWPKPITIKGGHTKEFVNTGVTEVMAPSITTTSIGVTNYDTGDKGFTKSTGKVDAKAGTSTGKWTFLGGTGQLSGITGGGTFACKMKGAEPGSGYTCDIKGSYTLPAGK